MKVYIVLRWRKIVKVYRDRTEAEKQVKKFVDRQNVFTFKDFTITQHSVF